LILIENYGRNQFGSKIPLLIFTQHIYAHKQRLTCMSRKIRMRHNLSDQFGWWFVGTISFAPTTCFF
jgi:hypothetical protein